MHIKKNIALSLCLVLFSPVSMVFENNFKKPNMCRLPG